MYIIKNEMNNLYFFHSFRWKKMIENTNNNDKEKHFLGPKARF